MTTATLTCPLCEATCGLRVTLDGDRVTDVRGNPDDVYAIALWAVPAGLIGARLYHVVTDWNRLYSDGRWWPEAFKVWNGGLGIPGGAALGIAVGVWVAYRRGWRVGPGLDALIPGIPLAQAIGRIGNWWNQEVFGRPTSLPWGLEISPKNRPVDYLTSTTFHPTFLYESVWNLAGAVLVVWLDRRLKLGFGRVFALYVMVYCAGRFWIESLRIDTIELNDVLGLRWGVWMSIVLFVAALAYFVVTGRRHRAPETRERSVYVAGREAAAGESSGMYFSV